MFGENVFPQLKDKCLAHTVVLRDIQYELIRLVNRYKFLLSEEYPDLLEKNLAELLSLMALADFFTIEVTSASLPLEITRYLADIKELFDQNDLAKALSSCRSVWKNIFRAAQAMLPEDNLDIALMPLYAYGLQSKVFKAFESVNIPLAHRAILHKSYQQKDFPRVFAELQQLGAWCFERAICIGQLLERYVVPAVARSRHRESEYFMKASLFFNAALTIYRRGLLRLEGIDYRDRTMYGYMQLDQNEKHIVDKLYQVYSRYLIQVLGKNLVIDASVFWGNNVQYKRDLEKIRTTTQERISLIAFDHCDQQGRARLTDAAVKCAETLYSDIATTFERTLLDSWFNNCIAVLGPAPCEYEVLTLGSLAIKNMTPYSDIELALLISEDTKTIKEYFYHWAILLGLQIQNLGESAIPQDLLGFSMDEYVRSGVQLDLGGKIPQGRPDQGYSLIQTPENMAKYVRDEAFKLGNLLPIEMCAFRCIFGKTELDLTGRYTRAIEQYLNTRVSLGVSKRHKRALYLFKRDIDNDRFNPFLAIIKEGFLFKIKEDIYRLPNLLLENAALYFGIPQYYSGWEKIHALRSRDLINDEAVSNLRHLYSFATLNRLKVYIHYRAQVETFEALFKMQPRKKTAMRTRMLASERDLNCEFTASQLNVLREIYKTLLPLHNWVQQFAVLGRQDILTQNFYDDSDFTLGQIACRLSDYAEAEKRFTCTSSPLVREVDRLSHLGRTMILSYNRECLQILREALNHCGDICDRSTILCQLGLAYEEVLDNHEEAIKCFREAQDNCRLIDRAEISPRIFFYIYFCYANIHKYIDTRERKRLLLEIKEMLLHDPIFKDTTDLLITVYHHLGNAYRILGDAREALHCIKQAFTLSQTSCSPHHPNFGSVLLDLASAYIAATNDTKAGYELCQQALDIYINFYGTTHIALVEPLMLIGQMHFYRNEPEVYQVLLEQSKAIYEHFYHDYDLDSSIDYARILQDLSRVAATLGSYVTALDYGKRVLAIYTKIFINEERAEQAKIHMNLSCYYRYLNRSSLDVQASKEHIEKAIQIARLAYVEPNYPRAEIYWSAGLYFRDLPVDITEAIKYFLIATRELEAAANCGFTYIQILCDLASMYSAVFDFGQATYFLQKAQQALQESSSQDDPRHLNIKRTIEMLVARFRSCCPTFNGRLVNMGCLSPIIASKDYLYFLAEIRQCAIEEVLTGQYLEVYNTSVRLIGFISYLQREVRGTLSIKPLHKQSYAEILDLLQRVLSDGFEPVLACFKLTDLAEAPEKLQRRIYEEMMHFGEKIVSAKMLGYFLIALSVFKVQGQNKSYLLEFAEQVRELRAPLLYRLLSGVYEVLGDRVQAMESFSLACHLEESLNIQSAVTPKVCPLVSETRAMQVVAASKPSKKVAAATVVDIHPGLQYQKVAGDGSSLYRAVTYYLGHGEDVALLRNLVAANLAANAERYKDFIPLRDGQSIQDYIANIARANSWAGELESRILMRLLDRPIVIVGPGNTIINGEIITQYLGKEPIFVFYEGGGDYKNNKSGHYDALILRCGYDGKTILAEMLAPSYRSTISQALATATIFAACSSSLATPAPSDDSSLPSQTTPIAAREVLPSDTTEEDQDEELARAISLSLCLDRP